MKTTKKQFEFFKRECEKWIKFFGITEYKVVYAHNNEYTDSIAWTQRISWDGNIYKIGLTIDTNKEDNAIPSLKMTAFHEVCHVLMGDYRTLAGYTFADDIVHKEEHKIIRRLENCIFNKLK